MTSELGNIAAREGRNEEALELMDRSARLAREIDFLWWEESARATGAEIALTLGDVEDARDRATSAVALAHSIGHRQGIVFGLGLLARVAADAGEADRAGRLWGAVDAEAERGPIGQWESERDEYAAHVLRVAGVDFDREREAGRRMSLDDAVAYAVGP